MRGEVDASVRIEDGHTPNRLKLTRQLVSQYIDTWYDKDTSWSKLDVEFVESLPGECIPPRGACLIAMVGDEGAGCVLLRPVDPLSVEVLKLYVHPGYRETGVARGLMEEAFRRAASTYQTMQLQVHLSRLPAISLYRSLGFVEQTPQDLPGYLEMRLSLAHSRETPETQ